MWLSAGLPVRARVTLAFGLVMALVLGATGLFLYLRLGSELDSTIQQGLRSRAADVSALIQQADTGLADSATSALTERGENLAQILDRSGAIVDSTPAVRAAPLLRPAEIAAAQRGPLTIDRASAAGGREPMRLLATAVNAQDQELVVVVGTSLEDREDALHNLGRLLLIGGPVALMLALLAGYGAAASALRPVERMRRRAAEIQTADPHARLPVPPVRDEIGRLGETLNAMLARLEAGFERERAFVSDASHELRTPLTILKGEVELALRDVRTREEMHRALQSVGEETERLVRLADDLLVVARADQGRLPVRSAEVALQELFELVVRRFSSRAAERAATLRIRDSDLVVHADAALLQQALENLVENALQQRPALVELGAEREEEAVILRVRDDGVGFPEPFLPAAFERFTRADQARGRGGAGLGLAIVAAIAEVHGGAAGARNRPDGGAEVWIRLPDGAPS